MLAAILLCVVGCAPKYSNILVDGKTAQGFDKSSKYDKKYKIIFDNEQENDLDYQVVYNGVVNAFKKNMYNVVDNIFDADCIVVIAHAANKPIEYLANRSSPIIGQVGSNTNSTYSYGRNWAEKNTHTTQEYGVIGYNHYQTKEKTYYHTLKVRAGSVSKQKVPAFKTEWEITLNIIDNNNDFRKVLPALLCAFENHMATDTNGYMYIDIYEKDGKLFEKVDKSN